MSQVQELRQLPVELDRAEPHRSRGVTSDQDALQGAGWFVERAWRLAAGARASSDMTVPTSWSRGSGAGALPSSRACRASPRWCRGMTISRRCRRR